MKILFIDPFVAGHHKVYLKALISRRPYEAVLILPEEIPSLESRQYVLPNPLVAMKGYGRLTGFKLQTAWMKEIKKIAEKEKPDVVHFLWGDQFYDLFGAGLSLVKKFHTVLTLHWAQNGWKGKIKTRFVASKCDRVVVHSAYIQNTLRSYGVRNTSHIEYPCFNDGVVSKQEGCRAWGIREDIPTLSIIGTMRKDKGADLLLEALSGIDLPYQLVISRLDRSEIDLAMVREMCGKLKGKVILHEGLLTERELTCLLGATDLVVLPYRRIFNGASGPLGEGVWNLKCIVGSDHGNLGQTITENHLGYTFECENVESLRETLKKAIPGSGSFQPDDAYLAYREQLKVETFQEQYNRLYTGFQR